jgi:hypothetical protein
VFVLRRIFRPKTGEVTGGWRKLHSKELPDMYVMFTTNYHCNHFKEDEMGRDCSGHGRILMEGVYWRDLAEPPASEGDHSSIELFKMHMHMHTRYSR